MPPTLLCKIRPDQTNLNTKHSAFFAIASQYCRKWHVTCTRICQLSQQAQHGEHDMTLLKSKSNSNS